MAANNTNYKSIIFTHKPIYEVMSMHHTSDVYGNKNSIICCQEFNPGLFSVALEFKNKVGAIINGFDDYNDFWGYHHGI